MGYAMVLFTVTLPTQKRRYANQLITFTLGIRTSRPPSPLASSSAAQLRGHSSRPGYFRRVSANTLTQVVRVVAAAGTDERELRSFLMLV